MGQRLIALAAADPRTYDRRRPRVAATSAAGRGRRASSPASATLGVPLSATLDVGVDVVIDFSVPAAAETIVEALPAEARFRWSMATTGLERAQQRRLRAAARADPARSGRRA